MPKANNIRFAALSVDAVCFRMSEGKVQVLLGRIVSDNNPYQGGWGHVGGLIRVDETPEQ